MCSIISLAKRVEKVVADAHIFLYIQIEEK